MCLRNPACQRCETCGRLKYQLWMSSEMHDRGCPFGAATMAECHDAQSHAGLLQWAYENGLAPTESGIAFLSQMERAGAVKRTDHATFSNGTVQ